MSNVTSSKPCVLVDLRGNPIKEFSNIIEASKYLNMTQITRYNGPSVISGVYRLFTLDFYADNLPEIKKYKSYTSEIRETGRLYAKRLMVECDLFPNEVFTRRTLADKMGVSVAQIGYVITGRIKKNPFNIRLKYPELTDKKNEKWKLKKE